MWLVFLALSALLLYAIKRWPTEPKPHNRNRYRGYLGRDD